LRQGLQARRSPLQQVAGEKSGRAKEGKMKAGVIFTGSGPILILTTYNALDDTELANKLSQKGNKKYMAFEVNPDLCRMRYGQHYEVILNDVQQQDDLRVLDYNGHNVFYLFSFEELGRPMFKEVAS
jgi:hypothetical protein